MALGRHWIGADLGAETGGPPPKMPQHGSRLGGEVSAGSRGRGQLRRKELSASPTSGRSPRGSQQLLPACQAATAFGTDARRVLGINLPAGSPTACQSTTSWWGGGGSTGAGMGEGFCPADHKVHCKAAPVAPRGRGVAAARHSPIHLCAEMCPFLPLAGGRDGRPSLQRRSKWALHADELHVQSLKSLGRKGAFREQVLGGNPV